MVVLQLGNKLTSSENTKYGLTGLWYEIVAYTHTPNNIPLSSNQVATNKQIFFFSGMKTIYNPSLEIFKYIKIDEDRLLEEKEAVMFHKKKELDMKLKQHITSNISDTDLILLNADFQYAVSVIAFEYSISELQVKSDFNVQYQLGRGFEEIKSYISNTSTGWLTGEIDSRINTYLYTIYKGVVIQNWRNKLLSKYNEYKNIIDSLYTSSGSTFWDIYNYSFKFDPLEIT